MPRKWKIAIGILGVAVVIGLISFRGLTQRIRLLSQDQKAEEQARREVLAPPITTPSDVNATAKIFWAAGPDKLAPVEMQLPLSADPAQRAKQVLHALITSPPSDEKRTLPADAEVLAFYVLPDGSAVADFSDALTSETPSGILSEQLTVDSIVQTLENNVSSLRRLKILIHGQEAETLAGHLDLTGFFDLNPPSPPAPATSDGSSAAPPSGDAAAASHPAPPPTR
jgi:Sporulation and spore germination